MDKRKPIIALDFPDLATVQTFLAKFPKNDSLNVKVGMELYYQAGPAIVTYLVESGHQVFLDLKLHDIPNTVGRAMEGLARLGVAMTNLHGAGGKEMMKAAVAGLQKGTPLGQTPPLLIAVTQLTSTSEQSMQEEQLITTSLEESVAHYGKLAQECGLDGVVCSAKEVSVIKASTSSDFLCVTPGIRPKKGELGDQKRVMTPLEAKQIGSDFIVVGRPITQAVDPYKAYQEILAEWNGEIK